MKNTNILISIFLSISLLPIFSISHTSQITKVSINSTEANSYSITIERSFLHLLLDLPQKKLPRNNYKKYLTQKNQNTVSKKLKNIVLNQDQQPITPTKITFKPNRNDYDAILHYQDTAIPKSIYFSRELGTIKVTRNINNTIKRSIHGPKDRVVKLID